MKKVFFILLLFQSVISFSQTDKSFVIYFINFTVKPIDISLSDSSYKGQGKDSRLKYSSAGKTSSFVRLFPNKHFTFLVKQNEINLKVKQVNFKEGDKQNESRYYCLNYLQRKKNKEKIPRYYKGVKKGVQNIGEEIAFNNITLDQDTTYLLVEHFNIFKGQKKSQGQKNSQSYILSPIAYRGTTYQDIASYFIFDLLINMISSGAKSADPIDPSKTFIEKIDKKSAIIMMQE